jgi:PIN domain nuclease of toxin-antitoxin system
VIEAFVTDTHPLLWLRSGAHRKLSKRARAAFDAYHAGAAHLYVPATVVLETWFLAKNGTIELDSTLEQWWDQVASEQLHFEALTTEDIFDAASFAWAHGDVYDRLTVATARRLGLPLVTADGAISSWGGIEVCW